MSAIAVTAGFAAEAAADPVIAAAGDIACDPTDANYNGGNGTSTACHQKATSNLLVNGAFDKVLPLGDIQYNSASLSNINAVYDPTWGRVKSTSRPILGNHESSGGGYFDYWNGKGVNNGPAGERGKGYYSYDVGAWHIVALNSNCSRVSCSAGSAQEQWLRADLAAHPNSCTLAYWHHARFSSGHDGNNVFMQDLWKALHDYKADVLLSGHSHNYERFAPLDVNGNLDRINGIRQFVVGTGGAFFTGLSSSRPATSEVRQNTTFGVLKLTLHPTSYDWQFQSEAGKTYTDSGAELCHGPGTTGDTQAPTEPTGLNATAPSSNRVDLTWNASSDNIGVTNYEIYRDGTRIDTIGPTTSYTDTTVSPGTAYTYTVKAVDLSGNKSDFSNAATVTTPAASANATLKFAPEADSFVKESSATTNYGGDANLRVDGGSDPDVESYLRFPVSGLSGTVQSAKLRVYAWSGTADGPAAFSTGTSWTETGINWGNRPGRTSAAMDDKAGIASNGYVEWDVTPAVTGNGTYSFALAGTSSDGVDFYSRTGTNKPELVVTTTDGGGGGGGGGTVDTEPPTAPTGLTANAVSSSQVDLSWTASSDNVAVAGYNVYRDGSLLSGAVTGTAYSDTTAAPNTTYSYTVKARDATGNLSDPSNSASATTPGSGGGGAGTLTFAPDRDSYVKESSTTSNYGTLTALRVDAGSDPDVESFLHFAVTGVTGTVQSAKLRVYATSGTGNGPAAYQTVDNWTETGITWANRPGRLSAAMDDKGALSAGAYVEWEVKAVVTGDGSYSFVLAGTSSDGIDLNSREASSLRPELVLTVG